MNPNKLKKALTAFLVYASASIFAQTSLPYVFSDHMVLQRNIAIPVWGTSAPAQIIKVKLGENSITTTADNNGNWSIYLPQMKAGGPYTLEVFTNENPSPEISYKDILIGDVWVASGQSNMEWQVQQSKDADIEIANANYPNIRFFVVPHDKKISPQKNTLKAKWEVCDTATVKNKSAASYFFARNLQPEINVPIGILQATWGGTPVEAWTSKEQLLASPYTHQKVIDLDSITPNHFIKDSLDLIEFWDIVYNPKNNMDKIIPKPGYNDKDWQVLEMPKTFKDWDMPFYEGMIWFRKTISIPKDMTGKDLSIYLGLPEMNYSLYFNGEEICKTIWNANLTHNYILPASLIKKGNNTITVRFAVLWGGGGFNPPAENMYITDGTTKISIAGDWKYKKDLEPTIPKINNYHQYPSFLYNAMINPVIPYGIKGFIWYQGENNVENALEYRELFPNMITDWRIRWQQGYLPFIYVQLANYMKIKPDPSESDWALLREAQTMTLKEPNTGMACIIDIGEENTIHPLNKQEVGKRLSLIAQDIVYKREIQSSGPVYKLLTIKDEKIIIEFDQTGSGLTIRGNDTLKGFAIAGDDKKYHWANATIDGNKVIVSSPDVKAPLAVRYAWADNPVCNLINKEGLPAQPFRTDNWTNEKKE